MAKIKLKAYPQSNRAWETLWKKFPAFAAPKVTDTAEKQGAFKHPYFGTGLTILFSSQVCYVNTIGARVWQYRSKDDFVARVALQIIYNPESATVKSCYEKTQTQRVWFNKNGTSVWDYNNMEEKEVTSTAPIVTFGKKEYIWLNKEECENGSYETMKLVELESHECAKTGKSSNDFAKAETLQQQYLRIATENCTKEELDMIVEMIMSEKDNYASTTPVFTSQQQKIVDKVQQQLKSPEKLVEKLKQENASLRKENEALKKQIQHQENTLAKIKKTVSEIFGIKDKKDNGKDGK